VDVSRKLRAPCSSHSASVAEKKPVFPTERMSSKTYDASSTAEEIVKDFADKAENKNILITGANTGLGKTLHARMHA
jgi:dethiobiotin synthetase